MSPNTDTGGGRVDPFILSACSCSNVVTALDTVLVEILAREKFSVLS